MIGKKTIITVVVALLILILGTAAFLYHDNHNARFLIPAANLSDQAQIIKTNIVHEKLTAEQLQQRKEYFYLLKDLDNMLFFSGFSAPEKIPAEELLLFAYTKATEAGLVNHAGGAKLIDLNSFTNKYFNRTLAGYTKTNYFTYDANTSCYTPTGWDFNVSQPHYLVKLSKNPDQTYTAVFKVYLINESDALTISPEECIADTSLMPTVFKQVRAEAVFTRKTDLKGTYLQMISYQRTGNEKQTVSNDKAAPYDPNTCLNDDEFVFAGGVRLGMSYEKVLEILGDYDEAYDNNPAVKSIFKDGCHYGFYKIDKTYTNQSDLKIDGVFRLLNLSSESYQGEFPRGIKIGDRLEYILNKFPGEDKKLRKWAHQCIYGQDKIGSPRACLDFAMYNECYRFYATTGRQVFIINFNRENRVRSIEMVKEDS